MFTWGKKKETKANLDDTVIVKKGPRNQEELDALWTQTRLPKKYRTNIEDWELDAMATRAEQEGRPLRSVIADRQQQQRDEREAKEFAEMPEHRHTFHTATHRQGFTFNIFKYVGGLFFMTFVPWFLFLGIGVMFILMYYYLPWITLLVVLIVGALSALLLLSGATNGNLYNTFLGVLFLIATCTGTIAGLVNYHERLFHYWSASEGRQYTNVRADSLAAAHADAGVMVFTDDAVVDTTKTIGYKSGSVYCVAPITRREQTHASQVQYWAAGTDCCNGRGFFNCDNSLDKAAKSGSVIRQQPASMLFKSEVDFYMHAMDMASEIYGLTASKEPFFLRWTVDVGTKVESYFMDGWFHWGYYGIAHLVINFVFACLLQGVIMQQKHTKNETDGSKGTGEKEPLLVTKGPGAFKSRKERWSSLDDETAGNDEGKQFTDQRPTPSFAHGLETLETQPPGGMSTYQENPNATMQQSNATMSRSQYGNTNTQPQWEQYEDGRYRGSAMP